MHLLLTICQQKEAAQLVYLVGEIDESMDDDGDVFMETNL